MKRVVKSVLLRSRLYFIIAALLFGSLAFNTSINAAFNFTATVLSDSQIKLQWTWVSGASYCNLYREGIDNPIKAIDINVDRNYLNYTDTGLATETSYTFRLEMLDKDGIVLDTATVSANTLKMSAPVASSASFDVNSISENNYEVTFKWRNSSDVAAGSIIKREDGTVVATIDDIAPYTVSGTSTYTFTDSFTVFNQPVIYLVASKDIEGHISDFSNAIAIVPITSPIIAAAMVNGISTISWQVSAGIENFSLERSKFTGSTWDDWQMVNVTLNAGSQSITDTPSVPGTYRYQFHAASSAKYTGYSNISNPVVKTAAPTNLKCSLISMNRIDLSWSNPANNESSILVERKAGSGTYIPIATLDKSIVSYSDIFDLVENTTYTYVVSAYEADNNKSSSNSFLVSIAKPLSPAALNMVVASNTRIDLHWDDKSNNENGFIIERKTDSGSFMQVGTVNENITDFTDTGVTAGHTYSYRVFSTNFFGSSSSSTNIVSCSTTTVYAPYILSVTSIAQNSAVITWNYTGSRNYTTVIERRIGSESTWGTVAIVPSGTKTYTNLGLTQNTQYYYRVKALIESNVYSLPYPNDDAGKAVLTKLGKPLGLSATMLSYTMASLVWVDNSDETEFVIERKKGTGSYSVVATVTNNMIIWIDTGLSVNNTYTYRVRAKTSNNWSDYSDECTVQIAQLAVPSNLTATVNSNTSVELGWVDNSLNETGFEIWRKVGSTGQWLILSTVTQNVKKYTDNAVSPNIQYYYKVRAYAGSSDNCSNYTAEVSVNTGTITAPSNLYVEEITNYYIKLAWKDNSNNETGFIIERKLSGGTYVQIAQTIANTTKYVDKGLNKSTAYYYRVKAINNSYASVYSQDVLAVTKDVITFTDLGKFSWARESIENMATRGIISGVGNNLFAPGKTISKAEFVALMIRSYKLGGSTPIGGFADVPTNKWYYKELAIAKMLGIISGDKNNNYYPDDPIIREDSAIVIANILKAVNKELPSYNSNVLDRFKDKSSISNNAISSMASLTGEGIFAGRTDGNIGPRDTALRAEVAALIYRIIDKYVP